MHGQRVVNIHKLAYSSAHGKRPTGAPAIKAVCGLLQSDILQVTDAKRAIDNKAFVNYKITASSLLAYEREHNMVVGKKYAELEGELATAASVVQEHGKNQAALKAQLATKVSTDFFFPNFPFPSLPFPSLPFPFPSFPAPPFLPLCPLLSHACFIALHWCPLAAPWRSGSNSHADTLAVLLVSIAWANKHFAWL